VHLEFLVEEPSMESTLRNLLPRLLDATHDFEIRQFGGAQNLLKHLPGRLRGYQHWISDDHRIIVVIDRDQHDCAALKQKLEAIAAEAGLPTKTAPKIGGRFIVVNRIVIEELEAWFFGDIDALVAAYPKVKPSIITRESYRSPDAIRGGTWEALHRVLREFGYYGAIFPKIEVATRVSEYLDPDRNRSPSFQSFVEGVRACLK
jgi:hypothetical protein